MKKKLYEAVCPCGARFYGPDLDGLGLVMLKHDQAHHGASRLTGRINGQAKYVLRGKGKHGK